MRADKLEFLKNVVSGVKIREEYFSQSIWIRIQVIPITNNLKFSSNPQKKKKFLERATLDTYYLNKEIIIIVIKLQLT